MLLWCLFSLQHKRSSSSKADANRASRRGRAKAATPTSRGGSAADLVNATDSSKKLATEPEEDDSYLFMGATAVSLFVQVAISLMTVRSGRAVKWLFRSVSGLS